MPEPLYTVQVYILDNSTKPIVIQTGLTWEKARECKTECAAHGVYVPHDDTHACGAMEPSAGVTHKWYPISSIHHLEVIEE